LSINSKLNTVSYNDVSGLDSNKNLKVKINQQEKLENKPILSRNNFKLSDFKENTTVVYVDTIVKNTLRTQTQVVPQAKTVTRIDTVYVNNNNGKAQTQKVYSEQKPPEIIYRDNTNTNSSTKTTTETTKIKEKEIVDAASFGLITTQMAQLLSMQQETNRLLQNQQNGVQIKPVVAQVTYNQKLDSLALKVALLEQRLLTMDSLLRIANSQKSNNSTKPIVKENLLIVQDKTPNKGKETTSDKPIVVKQDTPATNKVNDTSTIDCIITYPINQSDLSDMQRNLISSQILNVINKGGSNFVLLEAYTDSSGNPIYNKKLSDLRINKVISFLIANGIAKETILTKNFGEEKAQENVNPEERKIVFKIINDGK
jgi:outer membrane protein OmpA-like peptidoglycan-associated protein